MNIVEPLGGRTLKGRFVALEILGERHFDGLVRAGSNPAIWSYMPHDVSAGPRAFLDWLAEENKRGRMITYAVRRLADDVLVGSSSYLNIAPEHVRAEIGAT